jgi:hypothetical protein
MYSYFELYECKQKLDIIKNKSSMTNVELVNISPLNCYQILNYELLGGNGLTVSEVINVICL